MSPELDSPIRALSVSGGGMRGLYTAADLEAVAAGFAKQRGIAPLSLRYGFRLIAGTSTGAIIACAIATNLPLQDVIDLYRTKNTKIFPKKIPTGILHLLFQWPCRPSFNARAAQSLRSALTECFGN